MSDGDGAETYRCHVVRKGSLTVRAPDVETARRRAEEHARSEDFTTTRVERTTVHGLENAAVMVSEDGREWTHPQVRPPDIPDPAALGGSLRDIRHSLGVSIKDVADAHDISAGSISNVERGETTNYALYRRYRNILSDLLRDGGVE